jgi:peptide subunit release factor 1 (eRF1)
MMTREELRTLAAFESPEHGAISFYFQPWKPRDQSHRDESILVRDLVRAAEREADGRKSPSRADLDRILALSEQLKSNHSQAKAVFACQDKGLWRELDLPAQLPRTELFVNRRLHLRPLAALLDALPRAAVAVVDRKRARLFDLVMGQITEFADFMADLPRVGRSSYGYQGYNAGHVERHAEKHAIQHFKTVADRLLERYGNGNGFSKLIVGCRDEVWSEVESQLHPYLRNALVGRFSMDVATAALDDVRHQAAHILEGDLANHRRTLVREVLGQAQRNGTGSVGLRHVLASLERGEVQALLVGSSFTAAAVECSNCGHVDTRMVRDCAVCAHPTRELDDVVDALVSLALRNSAEILYVTDDADLERAGNVGALLRFRADQRTADKVAS